MDGRLDSVANRVHRFAKLVGKLNAKPVARGLSEIGAKVKVGLGGDPSLLVDDLVDPLMRQLRLFGQAISGDTKRQQKLLPKEFAWMNV